MLEKVKGLVIRSVDIKESDRLITIYTEEMGLVTALARGARSLKSRNMSSTSLFCYSTFVLYKRGENYSVKESELIESFFDIRKRVEGMALATYVLEIMCHVATADADMDLMRLALNTLFAIADGKYSLDIIKGAFEIRSASILGFMPDVLSCRFCREKSGDFYFDVMDGALTCYACHQNAESRFDAILNHHENRIISIISEGAKTALWYCIHCPIEKIFSFTLSGEDLDMFSRAAELYVTHQLERHFKALDFYKEVK